MMQSFKKYPLGFGCMGITAFYGKTMEDDDAVKLLGEMHKAGYHHFDTAEIYRTGLPKPADDQTKWNEVQVGKYLSKIDRDSFTIATKHSTYGGDAASVEAAINGSLQRLGLEYVDLYYLHRMPATLEDLLVWMRAVKKMVAAGKVKNVGLSEVSPAWLREAHKIHPIAAIQQEWSLLSRTPVEDALAPVCKELSVAIVAYSPLARNLLGAIPTEAPKDWRGVFCPRYLPENLEKNKQLLAKLEKIAKDHGKTMAQLSLAWLFNKADRLGVTVLPIPGTTKAAHGLDNLKGVGVKLKDADMEALELLAAGVAGERGDENYMKRAADGVMTRPGAAL